MKNSSLTFCTPDFLKLTLKRSGIVPEYTGLPLKVQEECVVRVSFSDVGNINACRRQINRKLPDLVGFQGRVLVFMDMGNQDVLSWKKFKSVWNLFVQAAALRYKKALKGFGLAGSALLLPANTQGHLSSEFLNALMSETPDIKEKWVGIPLTPILAEYYRKCSCYVRSIPCQPFESFHRSGFYIQGEIPAANAILSKIFEEKLLTELPGDKLQDKYCEFVKLLPGIDRIRLTDITYVDPDTCNLKGRPRDKGKREKVQGKMQLPMTKKQIYPRFRDTRQFIRDSYNSRIFNGLEIIEFMLTVTGHKKAMRTSVEKKRFKKMVNFLAGHGLFWKCVEDPVQQLMDKGKGGWSNLYHPASIHRNDNTLYTIYLGLSEDTVNSAYRLEDDNNAFGEIMSYPECCRASYERNLPISVRKQGDLVPIVAEQTIEKPPWSFLLNVGARYFEKALISFSPCSYACSKAKLFALEAFRQTEKYLPEYASILKHYLSSPVLYTEYRGIYIFLDARIKGSTLRYDPSKIQMTTSNSIGSALRNCNILYVSDKDDVQICRYDNVLKTLKGDNVKMLFFQSDY